MREELKRLWRGMLLITLLVVCMPQVVYATEADSGNSELGTIQDISTSGLHLTSGTSNEESNLPTEETRYTAGEGTVTWTPAPTDDDQNVTGPAVLTLNNATIKTTGDTVSAIDIYANFDVEIRVIGNCYLESQTGEYYPVMALQQKQASNKFSIIGVNGGTLEIYNKTGYYSIMSYAELYVSDVTLKTSSQLNSADEGFSVVGDLTFENATVIADIMYCTGKIHVISGTVTCSVELWPCEVITVDDGATITADAIFASGTDITEGEGTVNAFIYDADSGYMDIHVVGDTVLSETWSEALSVMDFDSLSFKITEGSSLTVPDGMELNLSQVNEVFSIEGTLEVNGTVSLPSSVTTEDIAAMSLTGDGVVKVVNADGTDAEQVYTTSGTQLTVVSGLDFTNVGDGEGQTLATGDGYVWDATTKTLTLTTAYVDGNMNLPASSKIILNGASVVTGDVTVAGAVSNAFTLSGEGTLASAGGKKYVSHAYGEPTFTWTETADGYSAKAVFTCQGGEDKKTVDATVTATTTEATYTAEGKVVYVAKVAFNGKDYTDSKEVVIPKNELKGVQIEDAKSKAIYKVTSVTATGGTVEYVKHKSKSVKTVTIPKTITMDGLTFKVTSIAAKAFKGYKKLSKVTIGNNVKTIGKEAFSGCKKLKTVKMGSNVTTIGDKVFYNCGKLTSITIPSKVSKIGKSAFEKCKKLKTITIKSKKLKASKVGKKAFKGIKSTATIKVPKSKMKAYKSVLLKKGVSKKATFKKS